MPVTFPRVPDKADAQYLAFAGVRKDDPVDFAINPTTAVDAKFLLKPIQDEILNLIALTAALQYTAARVYNSSNQSIPGTQNTVLTFDSARYDQAALHEGTMHPSRLTAPIAGKYRIGANVVFADNAAGFRQLGLYRNGAPIAQQAGPAISGVALALNVSTEYLLEAGDYVEALAYQNSGGALNASAEFWMSYIGGNP